MDFELRAGAVVGGDFRVLAPLAQGGMGAVYVTEQISTGRRRALKILRRDLAHVPGIADRFELEARVASRIQSDHVVEVVSAGFDRALGSAFLAMELLDGQSLDVLVKQRGGLPAPEAFDILRQVGVGLSAAHAVGVVHRDLKPENVFVSVQRDQTRSMRVKILDFGIAKVLSDAASSAQGTQALGTPRWMSPEQTEAGARVTPATDVWAFGLVAYHTLTGQYFWRGATPAGGGVGHLLREILSDPIPPASLRAAEQGIPRGLPPGFDGWLARCLARAPEDRFPSAREALEALLPVLGAVPSAAASTNFAPVAVPRSKGRGGAIAVGAVLATALLAGGGGLVAHLAFDAFGLGDRGPSSPRVSGSPTISALPTPPPDVLGQWAIAEGRSAGGQSYSGESHISQMGDVRFQRWLLHDNRSAEGFGLLDGREYSVAWGTPPFGLFVYRISGGHLSGRIVTNGRGAVADTETLEGPASLEGTFQIVTSSNGRRGHMTLRAQGPRFAVTRRTDLGDTVGVALRDGDRLVVALSLAGQPTGAVAYHVEPGDRAMRGSSTGTHEPGVGRETLAKRTGPIDPNTGR